MGWFIFRRNLITHGNMFTIHTRGICVCRGRVFPLFRIAFRSGRIGASLAGFRFRGRIRLHGDECINSVKAALASGARLIDTASAYGNEEVVGQAIRESIQACIDRLDIGYVDMMLLHHPDANDVKAYKAMEQFVAEGQIRSIGLSNWYVGELTELLKSMEATGALSEHPPHRTRVGKRSPLRRWAQVSGDRCRRIPPRCMRKFWRAFPRMSWSSFAASPRPC